MKSYASCILVSKNNEIILQLRDNNPQIKDPNCLSLFAGAIEPGETPLSAITREIKEETTLALTDFEYLFVWGNDQVRESHVFFHGNIDLSKINVQEGQGYRLIKSVADLEKHKFAPISKSILQQYFSLKSPR